MEITVNRLASGLILRVVGRVDAETSPELDKELKAALDTGAARVIVDMAGVDYIATGIRHRRECGHWLGPDHSAGVSLDVRIGRVEVDADMM